MFDFDAAIREASEQTSNKYLGAIVLGPSGAGKSYLLGTLGVKTLYLYTMGEDHGVKTARVAGSENVVPVCINFEGGELLHPDSAYDRLLEVLKSAEAMKDKGIEAIVVDGATELESIIRETAEWKKQCQTQKGGHSPFQEPAATLNLMRPIINELKNAQRNFGMHYAMTCILDVKDVGPNGEILEASPRLTGFSVAESVVQQFGDVLVVGRMHKGKEYKHKIQFMTDVVKASKDERGLVKRAINFSPRLAGLGIDMLPAIMDADLSKIVKMKEGV